MESSGEEEWKRLVGGCSWRRVGSWETGSGALEEKALVVGLRWGVVAMDAATVGRCWWPSWKKTLAAVVGGLLAADLGFCDC
jgi:predicted anti-sigma-YlaC factor YlaD